MNETHSSSLVGLLSRLEKSWSSEKHISDSFFSDETCCSVRSPSSPIEM